MNYKNKRPAMPWALVILLLLLAVSNNAFAEKGLDKTRILFIGNSYTNWIEDALKSTLKESHQNDKVEFSFITRGSTGLNYFAHDFDVLTKIMASEWDYVVLQEWSQGVGSSPENTKAFNDALYRFRDSLTGRSTPVLYMTWARENAQNYKSYKDMHKKVSRGYKDAAKEYGMKLAPVGIVWDKVRSELEKEGRGNELYEDDIGHPSAKGQAVITSVFFSLFFQDKLEWLRPQLRGEFTKEEWQFVTDTVTSVMKRSKLYKLEKSKD